MDTVTSKAETKVFTLYDFRSRIEKEMDNKHDELHCDIEFLLGEKYPDAFKDCPEGCEYIFTPFEMSEEQFEDLIGELDLPTMW